MYLQLIPAPFQNLNRRDPMQAPGFYQTSSGISVSYVWIWGKRHLW